MPLVYKDMYIPPELLKITYDIYIRKSTDDKDHQIASLQSQKDVLTKLAKENKLKVGSIIEESKSAKQPGRPLFNVEVQKIQEDSVQGLIIWDLSRASRNPVDSGTLSWLLQKEHLKAIITPQKIYLPQDNVLLLNVEFGMANQYLRDLSRNVKRGLQNKLSNGWRPGPAPEGYLNDSSKGKGHNQIIPDPDRFHQVKKMWDLLLTGSYTVPQILNIVNTEWKFKTRLRKQMGGGELSRSSIYKIFNNPFYYGWYSYGGQWYEGKHDPMITENDFNRAQIILGKRGKQRPKSREFSFTGMIECAECESMVTAEEKWQTICTTCKLKFACVNRDTCPQCNTPISSMTDPTVLNYIFYRCTKKKKDHKCKQKYLRLDKLEKQVDAMLSSVQIPEEFNAWAIDVLNRLHDEEAKDQQYTGNNIDTAYQQCVSKINNLVKLKISPMNSDGSLMSDEDFQKQMLPLQKEKKQLETDRKNFGKRVDRWLELSQKTFNFARYARAWFEHGSLKDKRIILQTIGSNLLLENQILRLNMKRPLIRISDGKKEAERVIASLEPMKETDRKTQIHAAFDQNSSLRRGGDSNPR